MSTRKKIREEVKKTVENANRLIDRGANKAGEVINRGVGRIKGYARDEPRVMPPAPPRRRSTVEEVVDDTGRFVVQTGKKALNAADRGVKKVGEAISRDPDLKRAADRGIAAVDKVVEKTVELAKKGLKKGEEILHDDKQN